MVTMNTREMSTAKYHVKRLNKCPARFCVMSHEVRGEVVWHAYGCVSYPYSDDVLTQPPTRPLRPEARFNFPMRQSLSTGVAVRVPQPSCGFACWLSLCAGTRIRWAWCPGPVIGLSFVWISSPSPLTQSLKPSVLPPVLPRKRVPRGA